METLLTIDPTTDTSKINRKRKVNIVLLDVDFDKAMRLQESHLRNYRRALALEKRGDLISAAKLYWKNIYKHGTDAPANFNRLLTVLHKLELYEDELNVALVFQSFVSKAYEERLNKRIERLRKKIQ